MTNLVVARNIKRIISEKGLKQKCVADNAGFTEKRFSDMVNGRTSIKADDIFRIQDALNVTANELFQRNG